MVVNKAGTTALSAGRDGKLVMWNVRSREKVTSINAHGDWVLQVSMAPNGRIAGSVSTDGTLKLWDLKSYKQVGKIQNQAMIDQVIAFTADGKFLVTSDSMNALQVHSLSPSQAR